MKKSIIILSSVIGIIIILFIIKSITTKSISDEEYFTEYLNDNSYIEDDGIYKKVLTDDDNINDATSLTEYDEQVLAENNAEYTELDINKDKFILKLDNRVFGDNTEKIYTGNVDLKKDNIIKFDYLINIYTSQVMVEGTYDLNNGIDDKNYNCSLSYESDLDEDETTIEDTYCLLAKKETLNFIKYITELKSDKRIYSMLESNK